MQISKILCGFVLAACADTPKSQKTAYLEATTCNQLGAVCEINVFPTNVGQISEIRYRLCCPEDTFSMSILEVSGQEGNWGDVTRWALCGRTYTEEFTHPDRSEIEPYAILSVFDGNGGAISSCRTSNAPSE